MDTHPQPPSTRAGGTSAPVNADHVYRITRPSTKLLTYYFVRSLLALPVFPIVFLYHFIIFKTLRYQFTDEGVSKSWGRLWKKEVYLTYSRIQDIHLSRDLIQRWIGLASIHLQTASAGSKPEMSIDGFLEFEMLRDFLYSRMRGAQSGPEYSEVAEPPVAAEGNDELLPLLGEIRDELRAMRRTIESKKRA